MDGLPLHSLRRTLAAGTRYADYIQLHLHNGLLRVFLVALLPLSALQLSATILLTFQPAKDIHP
jgi:hypothetical protein